jgi:membrane-associated phospholipid phosphatase
MRITTTCRSSGHAFNYDKCVAYGSVPVALVVYFCIDHLDRAVSLLIQRALYTNELWARHTSSLPDLLFISVLITTGAAYLLFRYRLSRRMINLTTHTCMLLAIVAPVSYIAKSVLKYVFGRITTREWLLAPGQYGFHWFQGGGAYSGFPSGHMLVFTALIAVMWRLHPHHRRGYLAFMLLLALAMIATNYHFVSDVIAGVYLGLLVEVCVWRIMTGNVRSF